MAGSEESYYSVRVVYSTLIPIICLIGLLGNFLILFVLSRRGPSSMRGRGGGGAGCSIGQAHVMYVYLRWLAIADILVMLVWIPIFLRDGWQVQTLKVSLSANRYFVHVGFSVINIFMATSSILVVLITVERYLSICFPLHKYRLNVPAGITCAFILPVLIYLPTILGKHVYLEMDDQTGNLTATSDQTGNFTQPVLTSHVLIKVAKNDYKHSVAYTQGYNIAKIIVLWVLPLVLITVLNTLTISSFRSFARRDTRSAAERRQKQPAMAGAAGGDAAAAQLTRLLAAVIVVYVVCSIPTATFHILHYSLSDEQQQGGAFEWFRAVTNLLGILNSAINFYVYCLTSREFRAHVCLQVHLPRWTNKDNNAHDNNFL